jgi:rubrerythrin
MTSQDAAVIEQAILKALEYEGRVRDTYQEAVSASTDATGQKIFQVLADEEQGHVDYLEHKLKLWRDKGELSSSDLSTVLPSKEEVAQGIKQLKKQLEGTAGEGEVALLQRALAVEEETSAFYRKVAAELPDAGRAFFAPFVTIEEGHVAIVQAELDSVQNLGFWFDYQEFDLEAG